MEEYQINLFLVSQYVRPGYLNDTEIQNHIEYNNVFSTTLINHDLPCNYIYNDKTYQKYKNLIDKVDVSDDELTLLLGFPSKMPPENTNRYGYHVMFSDIEVLAFAAKKTFSLNPFSGST